MAAIQPQFPLEKVVYSGVDKHEYNHRSLWRRFGIGGVCFSGNITTNSYRLSVRNLPITVDLPITTDLSIMDLPITHDNLFLVLPTGRLHGDVFVPK